MYCELPSLKESLKELKHVIQANLHEKVIALLKTAAEFESYILQLREIHYKNLANEKIHAIQNIGTWRTWNDLSHEQRYTLKKLLRARNDWAEICHQIEISYPKNQAERLTWLLYTCPLSSASAKIDRQNMEISNVVALKDSSENK